MLKTSNALLLPSGFIIALSQQIAAGACRLFLKVWGGYTITSHIRGSLSPTKRYVIAANHQSKMDPFAIFTLLGLKHRMRLLPLKFMTHPRVYHHPLLKPFLYVLGCFPAHNRDHQHHTTGVEGTIKLLDYGYNICMFPEGVRTLQANSNPKNGICRILAQRPNTELLLAHLEWQILPNGRRVKITVAPAPANLNKNDPIAIMNAIYAL